MKKIDILIVGAGPVGIFGGLLLKKHNIPFMIIEKNKGIISFVIK